MSLYSRGSFSLFSMGEEYCAQWWPCLPLRCTTDGRAVDGDRADSRHRTLPGSWRRCTRRTRGGYPWGTWPGSLRDKNIVMSPGGARMHRLDGPERERDTAIAERHCTGAVIAGPGAAFGGPASRRRQSSLAVHFGHGNVILGVRRGRAASWSTTKDATVAVCMGSEQLPDGLGCSVLC
jgi:hypothetical protein